MADPAEPIVKRRVEWPTLTVRTVFVIGTALTLGALGAFLYKLFAGNHFVPDSWTYRGTSIGEYVTTLVVGGALMVTATLMTADTESSRRQVAQATRRVQEISAHLENEALAHRWHKEVFREGKLDVADRILGPGAVFHMPGEDVQGVEAVKRLAKWRKAFPDTSINYEDAFSSGDKVALRWTAEATHGGVFPASVATGSNVNIHGVDVYRVQNGQIAEAWLPTVPWQTGEAES